MTHLHSTSSLNKLFDMVQTMQDENWQHTRRSNFGLAEQTIEDARKHLVEEVDELQYELRHIASGMDVNDAACAELTDVLGIVLHMAIMLGMSREALALLCSSKLLQNFRKEDP